MTTDNQAQVIVVGAGLSGLTAASELQRQGISVITLEASSRVGGRSYSVDTKLGTRIDLGGQWIGHGHHRLAALVARAGGTTYKTFSRGLPVIVRENRVVPLYSPSVILALVYLALLELASRVYVPRGWLALTMDKAVAMWVPLEITKQLLLLVLAITSTAELERASLYAFARALRLNGGLLAMAGTEGGAQDSLTVEAMGIVTAMLAERLKNKVLTDSPVTSVSQGGAGKVVVTTASGQQFHASKIIITVPPPMLKTITFNPPLPPARQALQRNTRMGVVYKALAIFDAPFWRDGLGGEFLVLDDPSFGVFDSTPPGPGRPGHLCFLVAGTPARQLDALDTNRRRELLLSRLVPFLGRRVLEPADWLEKAWHEDEHCGGGYLAFALAGTTEGLLPMPHAPVGDVHWAGTETAEEHPGYLEGAVQAGERAAQEVARAIVGAA